MSGKDRTAQVKSGYDSTGRDRYGQVSSGQARSGKIGQVRKGVRDRT